MSQEAFESNEQTSTHPHVHIHTNTMTTVSSSPHPVDEGARRRRRTLSPDEVDVIVRTVFRQDHRLTIPHEIHESIIARQKKLLRQQLLRVEVHPDALDDLAKTLHQKYVESQIPPGESVGILCAQSIGERQTQMTLNTFHAAGMTVQTVITGVPRFLELLNASKEPKLSSSRCYLRSTYDDNVHLLKQHISKRMIQIHLETLYSAYDILENVPENHGSWYSTYRHVYGAYDPVRFALLQKSSHFIRYVFSKEALYRYTVHMHEIMEKLYERYTDILCIISPNHIGILDVYVDPDEIFLPTDEDDVILRTVCDTVEGDVDEEGEGTTDHVRVPSSSAQHRSHTTTTGKRHVDTQDHEGGEGIGGVEGHVSSISDMKMKIGLDRFHFLNHENKFRIYLEDVVIPNLGSTQLFGIPHIKDYFIEKDPLTQEYILHTQGNNFLRLLTCPWIDASRTVSNNMWNIYEALGIEATREFLIQEFTHIVSSDGTFINDCHIALLVDIMTFSGTIVSVSRYGMKNDQFGALAKASFEESLDNFLKAGFFSERETTKDVSASIICGKRPNVGTGLCDVLLDMSNML